MMEVEEIIEYVFGKDFRPSEPRDCDSTTVPAPCSSPCLESAHNWVEKVMDSLGRTNDKQTWPTDAREGRIGPATVRFDITTHVGLFVVGSDRLSLNSQSNFSTIRANSCLYKGKWQYEIQLGSKGVMQIGWATNNCKFSQEIGVGDTVNSFAYDGNRIRKWNVSTYKYGESWLSGDIIGCTIDLDRGVMEFYRNGRSMGEAFDHIQLGPGMAYFPAVSLAFTENLVANFGSTPLRYPVPGFLPIQDAPYHDLAKAQQLCNWFTQLLALFDAHNEINKKEFPQTRREPVTNDAVLMGLARSFFHHLAPLLLSPYITEACLVPFLESLCHLSSTPGRTKYQIPAAKRRKLLTFLDMLWIFLEEHELKKCLESVVACLLAGFRHVSFVLDYPHQKKSLALLTYIVQHSRTRQHLLENVLFDKVRFANFVHVKPLDEGGLSQVVSHPWWESEEPDPDVDKNKSLYFDACQRIKDAISEVEDLQVELLKVLMDNSDGTPTQASSRRIFLRKFRMFLHENLISSRTMPLLQTPLPITLCCFHRLLVTFRSLWEKEVASHSVVVPSHVFYDGSINYYSIDRLGGVLSHLNKTLRSELIEALGPEHSVITALDSAPPTHGMLTADLVPESGTTFIAGPSVAISSARTVDGHPSFVVPVLARMLTQQQTSSGAMLVERLPRIGPRPQDKVAGFGCLDPEASLIELLDGLVLFYHVAAHKQLAKVSTLRESMTEYMTALAGTKARLRAFRNSLKSSDLSTEDSSEEIVQELERATGVFEQKLSEQARHMSWVRAAVYSPEKQSHLAWLLRVVLNTLKRASQEGQLFSFVPDFYLDSLIELSAALRTYVHPTAAVENIEGYDDLLVEISEFLCDHFADPRIVHANSKDTLIQALAHFVCSPNTLHALERVPYNSRVSMVRALLRPYEDRAWAQSNWVLVRIWQGCGFAFRFRKSPHLVKKVGPKLLQTDSSLISQTIKPCPSVLFQGHVQETLLSNEPLATAFLNSLLNQLNWAFSEFIGMLQEIQNVSSRPERVFIESRQLKICATCFDLALGLLRVLEMICSIAQEIFTSPLRVSSDLLLGRLCQLLCQVLNRVSSRAGCFQHVVTLEIPDLESVDHFPILAAVVGIILALMVEEIADFNEEMESVPKVAKALLSEPSFQIDSLHFVLGNLQVDPKAKKMKVFSFRNYADDVSPEEIEQVERMIHLLDVYQHRLSEIKILSDEEVCTICYAYPISATFKPCSHQSCRACIAHHLMNSRDCFFCKTPIQNVVGMDGQVLHELMPEKPTN
ncbi:E3 ubiquitin-protein ligase RNF123 isoform X2 [Anabrus simplex]|uniref:E3 ubiquitin-protein ligase RNF123 isoform X2 n=1 Tax=Anabrus simplex TaxID=316456 RepID=UPI0035A2DD05